MSDQWGTREHQADRHPPTKTRRETVPGTVNAQQAYAALATIALTIASLLCYLDRLGAVDVGRGVYAIAIGLFAVGGHGWSVCRAETRVRREIGGKVAELTTVMAELRDQIAHQRITYLPPPPRPYEGQRYIGSVAVGADDDTAPETAVGLDAESVAAARRITMRLRNREPN